MPVSDWYLDTNILLAACLAEAESPRVRRWLERAESALLTSDWAIAEFSSALGIKVRRGDLSARLADHAIAVLESKLLPAIDVLHSESDLVRAATVILRTYRLGLRTGDAMHLAFCLRNDRLGLATADRVLARAGAALGVEVQQVY
jgi:hypothetical protein